jgi:hypothetical protein
MIYFMQVGGPTGPVKIGCTRRLKQRFLQLQVDNHEDVRIWRLFEGTFADEKAIHARLSDHRINREWYRHHSDLEGDFGVVELVVSHVVDNGWLLDDLPETDCRDVAEDYLAQCGEVLYGKRWHADLCRALGISTRTMERWVARTHPVPTWVHAKLKRLMEDHLATAKEMIEGASDEPGLFDGIIPCDITCMRDTVIPMVKPAAERICTFRTAPDIWERLKLLAEANHRSASAEVRMLVERHVSSSAERELRALADDRVRGLMVGGKR